MSAPTLADVMPRGVLLGAFRGCDAHEHHHSLAYLARMEWTAVLDLLDLEGDIIGGWCIPDRAAWDWWVRAVELRATSADCPVDEPTAYAVTYAQVRAGGAR